MKLLIIYVQIHLLISWFKKYLFAIDVHDIVYKSYSSCAKGIGLLAKTNFMPVPCDS